MKASGLLLLRLVLSGLVAVWAAALFAAPEGGMPLIAAWLPSAEFDALSLRLLGGLGALLALLVSFGFFRPLAYPLLGLGFVAAAVAAWPFPATPLDLVAGGVSPFLLLVALALVSLVAAAFYGEDRFALDRLPARASAGKAAAGVPAEAVSDPSADEQAAPVAPEADPAPVCEIPAADVAPEAPAAEEAVTDGAAEASVAPDTPVEVPVEAAEGESPATESPATESEEAEKSAA